MNYEYDSVPGSGEQKDFSHIFDHLNDRQLEAVACTEGPLLILAGAGSGKTTVLINRIANIILSGRAQPWNIIAITFTNKAAGELKSRLHDTLGAGADDIWAQTFHSACVRILRRYAERIGYSTSFTIYDTSDSQSLVKRILKDLDLDEKKFPPRTVLNVISREKDAFHFAADFAQKAELSGDMRQKVYSRIYSIYERSLREADAMDFDDLILNTVNLLRIDSEALSYYQRKFRYVLIDEYQDTNNLQYILASLLASGTGNICVVGDDDQSIYKFRGATIENILNFEQQYPGCKVIRLEQNYRSTGHILSAANAVIANNTERKGKTLWTAEEQGELLTVYTASNQDDEAQYIADRILDARTAGRPWNDNAVLYRMNAQSNSLEFAFKRRGIPYKVYGGVRFFDRAEVKDMLAYMAVVSNPADDLRLLRIINTPARGIGSATMEKAAQIAAEEEKSIWDVLCADDERLGRSRARIHDFVSMIKSLHASAEELPSDQLYDVIIEKSGYLVALSEKDTPENTSRKENIQELKTNIVNYINESETHDTTLSGFLSEIALYTDLDAMGDGEDCVSMMTMHSAKGLEFGTVFIAGAEEGIFPGMKVIGEPEELEEERRLCYVAITRARRKLFITCARQRMLYGHTTNNMPSRFVDEIPPEHMEQKEAPSPYAFYGNPFASVNRSRIGYDEEDASENPSRRFGYGSGSGFSGSSGSSYGSYRNSYAPKKGNVKPIVTKDTKKAPVPELKKGDTVEHKSFGRGNVKELTPMGGDFLVTVEFEEAGTKRLMLKAAAKLLKKI